MNFMKQIGITLKPNSYTPEAYAYEKYLSKHGWQVQLDYELDPNNDVNIYFMGMRPFWQKKQGGAIEIHEYQSLSTPPYAKIKNYFKKTINSKPSGRIFLNNIVHKNLPFNDNIPYIYRDMGVDEAFFQMPNKQPDFDILYSGSVQGRIGLVEILLNLSKSYKVIVIGNIAEELRPIFKQANITLTGRVERQYLPELYRNARYGLNYTPDIYPYNIQTSTKTLEYLASGLQVISNKYQWAEQFFREKNYSPIWLERKLNLVDYAVTSCNMNEYSWSNILNQSNLLGFLMSAYNEN